MSGPVRSVLIFLCICLVQRVLGLKPENLSLETVLLVSRHGNRSPNAIVNTMYCKKAREGVNRLYAEAHVADGTLTPSGVHGMWNLGEYTYQEYVKTGFIPATYNKVHSQVFAASGYRTMISGAAWGNAAYNAGYANTKMNIPTPIFSTEAESDVLLEVRKSTCAARLKAEQELFDEEKEAAFLKQHARIISVINKVCDYDIAKTKELTRGEFTVLEAVKDIADALTGDLLEGYPLLPGLTAEDRDEFLQVAENAFHARHYEENPAMPVYLSGDFPQRMVKLFDRRVVHNTNTTVLEQYPASENAKRIVDATSHMVIPPKAPRRMFAYHAHRELLYGLDKLLDMDTAIPRPGVQSRLILPSTGMFFELYKDEKKAQEIIKKSVEHNEDVAKSAERSRKHRYDSTDIDSAYYVRPMVWVPCWDSDGLSIPYAGVDKTKKCAAYPKKFKACGQEYCPLPQFKALIHNALKQVGGDYKVLCNEQNTQMVQMKLKNPPATVMAVQKELQLRSKADMADTQNKVYTENTNNWVRVAASKNN